MCSCGIGPWICSLASLQSITIGILVPQIPIWIFDAPCVLLGAQMCRIRPLAAKQAVLVALAVDNPGWLIFGALLPTETIVHLVDIWLCEAKRVGICYQALEATRGSTMIGLANQSWPTHVQRRRRFPQTESWRSADGSPEAQIKGAQGIPWHAAEEARRRAAEEASAITQPCWRRHARRGWAQILIIDDLGPKIIHIPDAACNHKMDCYL